MSDMKKPSFTPGPWRKGPKHKDGSIAIHAQTASIFHLVPFASSVRQSDANANLIAAAPDLYEALDAWQSALRGKAMSDEEQRAYNLGRAALKLAREGKISNPHHSDASPGAAIVRSPPSGTAAPISNSEEDCHGF